MIVDVLRQIADWLSDGTSGVNAQLASLPDDVGDTVPPNVTVYDSTRYAWVARGTINRTKTGGDALLLIELDGAADVALDPRATGPIDVPVAIRYVARKEATDVLQTEAMQTLRAAGRVIAKQFGSVMTTSAFRRNSTDLGPQLEPGKIVNELERMEGDELVVARLLITVPAFDAWGLGFSS